MTGSDEKRRVAFLLSLQEQEQGRQCTRPFHAVHPNDCRLWNGLARATMHECLHATRFCSGLFFCQSKLLLGLLCYEDDSTITL